MTNRKIFGTKQPKGNWSTLSRTMRVMAKTKADDCHIWWPPCWGEFWWPSQQHPFSLSSLPDFFFHGNSLHITHVMEEKLTNQVGEGWTSPTEFSLPLSEYFMQLFAYVGPIWRDKVFGGLYCARSLSLSLSITPPHYEIEQGSMLVAKQDHTC